MQRKINFAVDEWYHLYNRGNDKKIIFKNNSDQSRFLKLLYICNSLKPVALKDIPNPIFTYDRGESLVDISAYCLMPNHFHLLIRERTEGGISLFMRKLMTGYSMYFNIKNERTGKLFEGPFKSVYVDTDNYFRYVLSYIHLNPVKLVEPDWKEKGIKNKDKVKKFLSSYYYSSYLDYLNLPEESPREEAKILNINNLPIEVGSRDFDTEMDDWLEYQTVLK